MTIGPILNPVLSPIAIGVKIALGVIDPTSRYFTTLDSVAQSYVSLNEAVALGTDDYEISVNVFYTGDNVVPIGNSSGRYPRLRITDDSTIEFSPTSDGFDSIERAPSNLTYGIHNIRATKSGLVTKIFVDGIQAGEDGEIVSDKATSFDQIGRSSNFVPTGGLFFNIRIDKAGATTLSVPLDGNYTPAQNVVLDSDGAAVGEVHNVGAEHSVSYSQREDGVWVSEDAQSILIEPAHPRQAEPMSRQITRFDEVAQSHINVEQWIETSSETIAISAVFSTNTNAQDNIVGLYTDDAMEAIGIRVDGGGYLKYYSSGFTPDIGTTFVADGALHRTDVIINKTTGFAAVFLDGRLEYTTTHSEPRRLVDAYLVSIASRVRATDETLDSHMNGHVMSVKVLDGDTVRLDMALDGNYEEQGATALSTTSAFGDEQFRASRISGEFAQTGPNVFEKLSEGGGDLGEYYVENPLEPDTLYRVQFTVESVSNTINIFTRGEDSNTIAVSGIPEGRHDLIVRTGAGGGLWFARSAFVGVIRDISIRKVEGPVGYAVNTAVGDSLHFTYGDGVWVSENMVAVTDTEVLGDDANPEYAFMGVSTQESETYRLSATVASYTGTTDSGWTGNGSGIPTSSPFRSGAQNVGDIVGGDFTATGTGSLGLYGRDNGQASYTDIQINKLLQVS